MNESSAIDDGGENTIKKLNLQDALTLAVHLQQQNQHAEAEALFCRILEVMPDNADALHYYGLTNYFQGDIEKGIERIKSALSFAPDYTQAHNNLGNIYLIKKEYEKAEKCYRKVLELDPEFQAALNNLVVVLKESDRIVEAIDTLLHAIQADTCLKMHYQNLGQIFRQKGELINALELYHNELKQRPFNPDVYLLLSRSLKLSGEDDSAVHCLEKLLELDPGNPLAQHNLSAYTGKNVPTRADDDYVRKTFDRFAGSFDLVLQRLDYKAPFLVEKAFLEISESARPSLDVLDAGCGTGLCGPLLRPRAKRLTGVDLSGRMLGLAKERQVYDELVEAELTAYLQQSNAAYDVIVSADVLCYFGDLLPVLTACIQALKPEGYLIFTVEKLMTEFELGYRLNHHGRFSHSQHYIESTLADAGFNVIKLETVVLRLESGEPVEGYLITVNNSMLDAHTALSNWS